MVGSRRSYSSKKIHIQSSVEYTDQLLYKIIYLFSRRVPSVESQLQQPIYINGSRFMVIAAAHGLNEPSVA